MEFIYIIGGAVLLVIFYFLVMKLAEREPKKEKPTLLTKLSDKAKLRKGLNKAIVLFVIFVIVLIAGVIAESIYMDNINSLNDRGDLFTASEVTSKMNKTLGIFDTIKTILLIFSGIFIFKGLYDFSEE